MLSHVEYRRSEVTLQAHCARFKTPLWGITWSGGHLTSPAYNWCLCLLRIFAWGAQGRKRGLIAPTPTTPEYLHVFSGFNGTFQA